MKTRTSILAVPSLLLIAACGSTAAPASKQAQGAAQSTAHPTAHLDPRQAVLESVQKTSGTSFLADMSLVATVTATGPSATFLGPIAGQDITATMQVSAESQRRMRLTIDASVAGKSTKGAAVVYDNTVYISSDGGATYKAAPISGTVADQVASTNTLSYLQSVGTVTDEGAGSADGVAVERYSAQLDGAKVLKLIQAELVSSAQSGPTEQLLKGLTFNGGAIEVTVDHEGRIVTEHGPIDASVDLGAFGASLAGTRMSIHEVIDAHFHDYGSAVTVTRPAGTASS